jgi:single-strand DNA-binding protein
MWGRRAEALAPYLCKGTRVFVEGRLSTSSYEKDGQKHYSTEVVAHHLLFCGGKQPSSAAQTDVAFSSAPPRSGNGGFTKPPLPSVKPEEIDIPF